MATQYYARRPHQYGPKFPEDMRDLDQVFELMGEVNDATLVRLGYVSVVPPKAHLVACGGCGKKFVSEHGLNRHGRLRHGPQRRDVIKDDNLPPIDLNDPGQLEERAQLLRDQLKHQMPAEYAARAGMPAPEVEDDADAAREDSAINRDRPVFMDKTAASLKDGDTKAPDIDTTPETTPEVSETVETPRTRKAK